MQPQRSPREILQEYTVSVSKLRISLRNSLEERMNEQFNSELISLKQLLEHISTLLTARCFQNKTAEKNPEGKKSETAKMIIQNASLLRELVDKLGRSYRYVNQLIDCADNVERLNALIQNSFSCHFDESLVELENLMHWCLRGSYQSPIALPKASISSTLIRPQKKRKLEQDVNPESVQLQDITNWLNSLKERLTSLSSLSWNSEVNTFTLHLICRSKRGELEYSLQIFFNLSLIPLNAIVSVSQREKKISLFNGLSHVSNEYRDSLLRDLNIKINGFIQSSCFESHHQISPPVVHTSRLEKIIYQFSEEVAII